LFVESLEPRALPSFLPAVNLGVGAEPSTAAVADFNGDGIPDIVTANASGNNVSVLLLGLGDGTFRAGRTFAAGGTFRPAVMHAADNSPFYVAVGDFTGNGIDDIAVTNFNSHDVSILLSNGNGTFQPAVNYVLDALSGLRNLVVKDLTGTGIPDIVVAGQGGAVFVLLGNGDGTFQSPQKYAVTGSLEQVAVGDFTGDGVPDIAVSNFFSQPSLSVLLGNGDGTFQAPQLFNAGSQPIFVAAGDFNGDGADDLAVARADVGVLLSNGDGTFGRPQSFAAGTGPRGLAVADLNGDGRPDLIVANGESGDLSILLNDGNWPPQPGGGHDSRPSLAPTHRGATRVHTGHVATPLGFATPLVTESTLSNMSDIVAERPLSFAPQPVPEAPPMTANEPTTSALDEGAEWSRRTQDLLFTDIDVVGLADPLMEARSS
jgi:hypothetical protein